MNHSFGIRREDKNKWERRVPLIPSHVRELVEKQGLSFYLQPAPNRIFPDEDYQREGAIISEDLSPCPVVFAVKEIPVEFLQKDRVYVFFSHTIKGQPDNMPMLRNLMDLGCTLIDYEKICDSQGRRLVFFGPQAGQAGMIDTLWALGRRLLHEGYESPFTTVKQGYKYSSLVEAKEALSRIGWTIKKQGLPPSLTPLVIGFAGYGRVSQGAQEIFDILPFENILPENLSSWFKNGSFASDRLYKVVFEERHMVENVDPELSFELQDYYDFPEKYRSVFHQYIPFLSVIVNCIYWTPQYPRLVTKDYLRSVFSTNNQPRLRVIGDISCDIEGSIECTLRATSPDSPVYVYDPLNGQVRDGIEGRGVVIMAIDNLPAEIPLESSVFFSESLKPFIPAIAKADYSVDFANCSLPSEIKGAVILYKGELTPDFEYMIKFI